MSRLTDLLAQTREIDPKLASELEKTIKQQYNQQTFGLVFERHLPDNTELPSRPVRRGDNVRVLPPRGSLKQGDPSLWRVTRISRNDEGRRTVQLSQISPETGEEISTSADAEDLVVVARHDDIIYPGLVQTGEVINSADPQAPFHTVINSENLHALTLLTYTHRHKVDCIYIDPPYNTGAKDWKYNNDYVDVDDGYRHSKWLSFMERRLLVARQLLNPEDSVLIVTIDEKEYLRLGMLLEQTFPGSTIQMISSVISAKGVFREGQFSRIQEYVYIVTLGGARISPWVSNMIGDDYADHGAIPVPEAEEIEWLGLRRREPSAVRGARPNQFFPIYVNRTTGFISGVGDAVTDDYDVDSHEVGSDTLAVWPTRGNGAFGLWGLTAPAARRNWERGLLRVNYNKKRDKATVYYLASGTIAKIDRGDIEVYGHAEDGSVLGRTKPVQNRVPPKQVWNAKSHNSETFGTRVVTALLPGRRFPFPKSLYAVEDALRFFVKDKPNAIILDFFSGSGTTAHAVLRLNKQDGGNRRSISVTNNEVSFEEAKKLVKDGYRPGDPEWERLGICDYVTKPRIEAAITGRTPESEPIKGDYKFTDEFPMSDGFEANARFFTLTYEPPTRVQIGRAFDRVAPLLWMRAGQFGQIIESIPEQGWAVVESHGVLARVAETEAFSKAVRDTGTVTTVYIVTDDDLLFQSAIASMPDLDVEFVQLYSSYLTNFSFTSSQGGA